MTHSLYRDVSWFFKTHSVIQRNTAASIEETQEKSKKATVVAARAFSRASSSLLCKKLRWSHEEVQAKLAWTLFVETVSNKIVCNNSSFVTEGRSIRFTTWMLNCACHPLAKWELFALRMHHLLLKCTRVKVTALFYMSLKSVLSQLRGDGDDERNWL